MLAETVVAALCFRKMMPSA